MIRELITLYLSALNYSPLKQRPDKPDKRHSMDASPSVSSTYMLFHCCQATVGLQPCPYPSLQMALVIDKPRKVGRRYVGLVKPWCIFSDSGFWLCDCLSSKAQNCEALSYIVYSQCCIYSKRYVALTNLCHTVFLATVVMPSFSLLHLEITKLLKLVLLSVICFWLFQVVSWVFTVFCIFFIYSL